jgi:hypothetical protein
VRTPLLLLAAALALAIVPARAQERATRPSPPGSVPPTTAPAALLPGLAAPATAPAQAGSLPSPFSALGMPSLSAATSAQPDAAPAPLPFDTDLRMRQPVWDRGGKPPLGPGQIKPGVRVIERADEIVTLTLRQTVSTMIVFPSPVVWHNHANPYIEVLDHDADDRIPTNRLSIKPSYRGSDTNLTVLTKDGKTYVFRMVSEGTDSPTVTDWLITVAPSAPDFSTLGQTPAAPTAVAAAAAAPLPGVAPAPIAPAAPQPNRPPASGPTASPDQAAPIDRGAVVKDLKVYGRDDHPEDASIAPESVWRDNLFTYIEYGARFREVDLPVVSRLSTAGVENQVQWRIDGTRIVVVGIGDFVLRHDQRVVCIKRAP